MLVNNRVGNNVGFGIKYIIDIGASDPRGTGQVRAVSDMGDQIYTGEKGVLCPNGIRNDNNNKDFLNGILGKIVEIQNKKEVKDTRDKFVEEGRDSGECTGILILTSGAPRNNPKVENGSNHNPYIPNILYDGTNKGLKDVYFNKAHMEGCSNFKDLNMAEQCNILALNDMMGATVSIAKYIAKKCSSILNPNIKPENDLFKPKIEAELIYVGGGMGQAGIEMTDGHVRLKGSEAGHTPQGKVDGQEVDFEEMGASVRGVIRRFVAALEQNGINLPEGAGKQLEDAGVAKIITSHNLKVEKGSEEYNKLMGTGLFDESEVKDDTKKEGNAKEKVNLTLKGVSDDQHKQAADKAIDAFAEVMARAITTIAGVKGEHAAILTGPLTTGLDSYVQGNSDGKETLIDKIKKKIPEVADQTTLGQMQGNHLLDNIIIVEDVKSNLQDAELLMHNDTKLDSLYLNDRMLVSKDAILEKVKKEETDEMTRKTQEIIKKRDQINEKRFRI